MVDDSINLRELNLEELNGVVNLYPWFGGARKELCRRMSELGEGAWSDERYADAALYVGSRRIVAEMAHKGHTTDFSDSDVKELLRSYIDSSSGSAPEQERRVIVVGGDYFSKAQYEQVRKDSDKVFSSFAQKAQAASAMPGISGRKLAVVRTQRPEKAERPTTSRVSVQAAPLARAGSRGCATSCTCASRPSTPSRRGRWPPS